MKLHRNLALAVINTLYAVFEERQVASRALERLFAQNPKWGKRDRAFVAETTYEIVRWQRLLEAAAGSSSHWALLAAQLVRSGAELPDWEELTEFDGMEIKTRLEAAEFPRAVRESIPDWLDELGENGLGERWSVELSALNEPAPVIIRANTLKTSRKELQRQLAGEEIPTVAISTLPDALQLETRRSISHLPLYKNGFFEFQDAASQLVAPFMELKSGLIVLDACAGAGGKSLHIGALMGNLGRLVASDVEQEKLIELRRRAQRNGVTFLETSAPDKVGTKAYDRILIDAPCSGLGTLRRQPDIKWRLTPEFIEQITQTQREILMKYSPFLKPGGKLVYATCSILPQENEEQIEWFLEQQTGFELEEARSISTAGTGFDGFFMARLRKN